MASLDEVHLAHAGFRLSVCPALGGAITRFALDDFDLLRLGWQRAGASYQLFRAGAVLQPCWWRHVPGGRRVAPLAAEFRGACLADSRRGLEAPVDTGCAGDRPTAADTAASGRRRCPAGLAVLLRAGA